MADKLPPQNQSARSSPSNQTFEFILVSNQELGRDPETKRRVRSHAQADYRRRNPQRWRQTTIELDIVPSILNNSLYQRPDSPGQAIMSSPITLLDASRSDPFGAFNIDGSHRSRQLWDHVYDGSCPKFRTLIAIGFIDLVRETMALSQMLSASAWHRVHYLRCDQDKGEDARYSMITSQSLQKKLNSPHTSTTFEVITTVLASAAYANLTKDPPLFRTHMDGLSMILRERERTEDPEIPSVLKIAIFWIEVNGCFQQDCVPQFPQPYHLLAERSQLSFTISDEKRLSSSGTSEVIGESVTVNHICQRLLQLNQVISAELLRRDLWYDVGFAVFHLTPILHELFSISRGSVHDNISIRKRECIRLAAILYISNLRARFDFEAGAGMLYGTKLQMLLNTPGMIPSWENSNVFLLWILTVAACSDCLFDDLRHYFIAQLSETVQAARISAFEDFLAVINGFIWYKGVFGLPLDDLKSQIVFSI